MLPSRTAYRRSYRVIVACLASILLALAALPVVPQAPARAQGGLPEDQQVLLERVLNGIENVNSYASYRVDTDFNFTQDYTVNQGDQALDRQRVEFIRQESGAYIAGDANPNIDQHMLVSEIVTNANGIPAGYILEADVRVVDGKSYVNAAYNQPEPDLPTVPEGWIELTDAKDLQIWPGLNTLINPDLYLNASETTTTARILDITPEVAREFLGTNAASASSEKVSLDDGRSGEAITLALNPEALAMAGLSPENPINQLILDALTGTPLVTTFVFDASENLIAYEFTSTVALEQLDISSAPDVPPGITLSITLTQTYRATLTDINAEFARVEAPTLAATNRPIYAPPLARTVEQPWWNDRVFYEIFVRSFYDSDGDGIGDLRGVIEKLDYLNDGDSTTTDDLGVTGIWLMPIAQSPSYHGYDVTDYYTIEADYGTNQDFLDLMAAAHERGIVVIVDLVLNHTSTEHPWFIAASEGDPAYEDYYRWSDVPLDERTPWGSQAWHPLGDRYYFGMFWSGMPDLNYNNPAVTDEMYDVIRFWLDDMGADGFRLDAIRHLYEDGAVMENLPETLAWLEDFHLYVHDLNPDALTVGEVWDASENVAPYVGDKVNIAFEFDLATAILQAANLEAADPLIVTLDTITSLYPTGQYATFLTNHDQNRVMNQLNDDTGAAKVAATMLLTAPGVPFIYYGEEVGMLGEKPDERIRTPMQWDATRINGGFTTGQPWEMLATGYRQNNVASMTDDPDSLLSHYRSLVQLRDTHPALRTGTLQVVETGNRGVYSIVRYGTGEALLVLVNLSGEAVTDYALTMPEGLLEADSGAQVIFGTGDATAPTINASGGFSGYVPLAELAPRSSTIIRMGN